MALDTLQKKLAQGVSNVKKLQQSLSDLSKQIAKEREVNATKQTVEQQLLPKQPSSG